MTDIVQKLCFHAGWIYKQNNYYNLYKIYIYEYYDHKNCLKYKKENIIDYQGSVYCLEVPNEVFYIRRNNKACWTGNSRAANGPVVLLTHQPSEGRQRDGGLRLGEMEGDCLISHGTQQFLKERFMECSDNYKMYVCNKCNNFATVNKVKMIYNCRFCNNQVDFSEVRIPYSCKLLLQEIETMSIGTKFIV